jgi:hypothetical protein
MRIKTNCLTEIFIDRALERARELDEVLGRTGKIVGPLHGLPISLKGGASHVEDSGDKLNRMNVLRSVHDEGIGDHHG